MTLIMGAGGTPPFSAPTEHVERDAEAGGAPWPPATAQPLTTGAAGLPHR